MIAVLWGSFWTHHLSSTFYHNYKRSIKASLRTSTRSEPAEERSDFVARCNAPGVARCFGFDSASEMIANPKGNFGLRPNHDGRTPEIDTTVRASGAGSLKFTIPSNTYDDPSGSFFANFSSDLATQFGEGQEFYVQWRQRFDPGMLRYFKQSGGGYTAWKQVIIGEGDQPRYKPTDSCTELEVVMNQKITYMGPFVYTSCGRYIGLDFFDGAQDRMQHQGPPFCYYPDDPRHGCFRYAANEWMTFQVNVKIGKWNTPSSRIRVWAAHLAQPSIMIYDTNISSGPGYTLYNIPGGSSGTYPGAKYGKIWLLTYMTKKDGLETYPTAYTWYDDLIISRQKIAEPK